ncbi:uncharacterized protein LOC34621699 [Cyclospora cayetanensis]|uniref:Uncharacterized protein LOC34621699 n=1 Tax=Cyclospora cayetanensis TaxID=88456 RepID=A0A6P6S2N6_9EIME|nr:uncharacterized protein LOC34621699 [Cyclospora cayetanensis]
MCDGVTLEDLRNQIDGGQQTVETGQAMKFTYKRRLFSSANDDHELIVPASTRAVKVNKFQSDALQVYTADERGSIRLWDLSKVQERSALEAPNTPSKNREIIRLVGETEDKVSRCDTNAASATKMRRGVMAMYSRTFLTQPSSDWTDKGNVEPDGISMLRKRRDGTQEAALLCESTGHDGAVMGLDLCDAEAILDLAYKEDGSGSAANVYPRWVLSVGADRVVKAWTLDLKPLGQLNQVSA